MYTFFKHDYILGEQVLASVLKIVFSLTLFTRIGRHNYPLRHSQTPAHKSRTQPKYPGISKRFTHASSENKGKSLVKRSEHHRPRHPPVTASTIVNNTFKIVHTEDQLLCDKPGQRDHEEIKKIGNVYGLICFLQIRVSIDL